MVTLALLAPPVVRVSVPPAVTPNWLAALSVIPAVPVKVELPVTRNAPVCVKAPVELIVRLPPNVPPATWVATVLTSVTLLAPLFVSVTSPFRLFAKASVIAFAPALNVAAPAPAACVIVPVCVIAPPASRSSVPLPTVERPTFKAVLLVSATLLAPLLLSNTDPVR